MKDRTIARHLTVILMAVAVFAYLAGAFYSVSFDISTWDPDTRAGTIYGLTRD